MQSNSDVIHLPIVFPNSNAFRLLQVATQEESPILLGRVVSVAIAVASQGRVVFTTAELDLVAAWRPRPETFGEMLDRVGWARVSPSAGTVEVTLPSALQPLNPKRISGQARAAGAKRDETGRYLPSEGAAKRKPTRPRITVNAAGLDVCPHGVRTTSACIACGRAELG